jgi:hypothetical protein
MAPELAEKRASIQVTFREGVDIDQIHAAITRVVEVSGPDGCRTCGLVGIDFLLSSDPPELYEAVGRLEGVLAIKQA